MVLPELKQLASSLGIKTTGLKKKDLVAAITESKAEAKAGAKAEKAARRQAAQAEGRPVDDQPTLPAPALVSAPSSIPASTPVPVWTPVWDPSPVSTPSAGAPPAAQTSPTGPDQTPSSQSQTPLSPPSGQASPTQPSDEAPVASEAASDEGAPRTTRRSRRRIRQQSAAEAAPPADAAVLQEVGARLAAMGMEAAVEPAPVNDIPDDDDDFGPGRRGRRRRNRERQSRRRPGGAAMERLEVDPQVREDDVLAAVSGIVDVMDSYAFVRTNGYLPSPEDAYMSLAMVRRYGLRKGDMVTGAIRQPNEGERKEKFNPLVRLNSVNGADPALAKDRPEFTKLTPLYPQERLRLEHGPTGMTGRIMDLVSPIGKGQRGLIVSPPKAGKTLTMQAIANAITANNPEVHLMVVLVDERPEEVTDFQRTVSGEVIASTFDRPADDHTTIAELALERAKRLVELGQDVVILLDGITRLSRAYNLAAPASGRILSGGVDSAALYPPKKFFGAARNIEDGGSLTILATALIETGSKMDEVIFEEFKGTGNMELRLRRDLADKRVFPAIDVDASGTRREELLLGREELAIIWKLRRVLSGMEDQAALEMLLKQMRKTSSNHEFLIQISRTTP
jgi:transcription termination factor Rho